MSTPVILRPLGRLDLPQVRRWSSAPEVEANFGRAGPLGEADRPDGPTGSESAGASANPPCLRQGIFLPGEGIIGLIELRNISWSGRSGELCILIGEPRHRGRGYGGAAIGEVLKLAFGRLRLRRLYLRVARSNLRARRCYHGCGFRVRGILPPTPRQPDRPGELLLMELERDDYLRSRLTRA